MSEKLLFKSKKSRPEKEWKYKEYIKMRLEAEKMETKVSYIKIELIHNY